MQETKIPHILTTSANLLGVCFFIITGIHLVDSKENIEIMRVVIGISFLLLTSCFLSYMSIRSKTKSVYYEQIADYCFLVSIALLFVVMGIISFNFGILR